jgi:NAD(P)H-hydrate epimerase
VILAESERYDVMVLGPGLGPEQGDLVSSLVAEWDAPLVIDADGLNALDGLGALAVRQGPTVITPHAGEFTRLTGRPASAAAAMATSDEAGVVVLLKGNPTVIAGAKAWLVSSGGAELATIGTGDVLAGAIGALWARGLDAEAAARSGAFWHGVAGDSLRRRGSVAASELTAELARYAFD